MPETSRRSERQTYAGDSEPFAILPEAGEALQTEELSGFGSSGLDEAELSVLFRDLLAARVLDEALLALQRQGKIGFYASSRGQEAVAVGVAHALSPADWVFPALRENALALVRGQPLNRYLAQLFGNALDSAKGRQMPNHISSRAINVVSWSSCVGTQIPHAVGAAYAAKLCRDPVVAVAFLGDGATSTADFHAALNFAAVYNVPCVFVCQNNQWSISVPVSRQTAAVDLRTKALAYNVAARRVDGNDVLAVKRAMAQARARALAGGGPSFLECVTYRVAAHSSSDDPELYQPEAERKQWLKRDPVERLFSFLSREGQFSVAERERLADKLKREIKAAVAETEHLPPPSRKSLFDDVYARPPWHLDEQANA